MLIDETSEELVQGELKNVILLKLSEKFSETFFTDTYHQALLMELNVTFYRIIVINDTKLSTYEERPRWKMPLRISCVQYLFFAQESQMKLILFFLLWVDSV